MFRGRATAQDPQMKMIGVGASSLVFVDDANPSTGTEGAFLRDHGWFACMRVFVFVR